MRLITATWLALVCAALFALPAYAAREDVDVKGGVEVSLGDYDIVIGDLGTRYVSWDDSPTRVQVEILDGSNTREHYFDSLPAALFVLRQMYGDRSIKQLGLPDYAGRGLIDGTQAYYVWDYDHQSRGGLPLVLAFGSNSAAENELLHRNGEILNYNEVVYALDTWADNDRERIYWRGTDNDRWDTDRWTIAWNDRWGGWGWDTDRGWLLTNAELSAAASQRNRDGKQPGDRARQTKPERNRNYGKQDQDDRGRDDEDKKDKSDKGRSKGNGKGKAK